MSAIANAAIVGNVENVSHLRISITLTTQNYFYNIHHDNIDDTHTLTTPDDFYQTLKRLMINITINHDNIDDTHLVGSICSFLAPNQMYRLEVAI